jgi:aryl-alcohol dehydrogenase
VSPGGFEYILEITGHSEMLGMAVDLLAPLGTVALIGGAPAGTQAPIDMTTLLNGRFVRGVVQGDAIPKDFIPQLIEFHRNGKFPFDQRITHYDFHDINTAVEAAHTGGVIKPVLRLP